MENKFKEKEYSNSKGLHVIYSLNVRDQDPVDQALREKTNRSDIEP
jgi:hypothetical protein